MYAYCMRADSQANMLTQVGDLEIIHSELRTKDLDRVTGEQPAARYCWLFHTRHVVVVFLCMANRHTLQHHQHIMADHHKQHDIMQVLKYTKMGCLLGRHS